MNKRILIVEHEGALALEMAAVLHADGFTTSIAPGAGDAFREMEERRPDLLIVRAELPDQNGFSLCARVRRSPALRTLPIVLASTDSTPEALREHASHPNFAANAYLLAPYGMDDLRAAVHGLLPPDALPAEDVVAEIPVDEPAAPPEDEPDLGASLQGDLGNDGPPAARFPEAAGAPTPPKLPRRERRSAITDEDKSFLERVFGTIADRKSELLVEARSPRKSRVGRDLINTPEGKLQLLRDELRGREAQIARLSEIWAIRDRELSQGDDRLHEKEVEIQALKMKGEDLVARLAEARGLFLRKEREHGQAVDEMLQRQFAQEKELIEVVAGKEKELDGLRRDLANRESEFAEQTAALEALARNREERVAERDLAAEEGVRREAELLRALAGCEVSIGLLERAAELDASVRDESLAADARREAAARQAIQREVDSLEFDVSRLAGELWHAQALLRDAFVREADREVEAASVSASASAERSHLEAIVTELEIELHESEVLGESLRAQRDGLDQALRSRIEARDHRIAGLEEELTALHAQLERREEELSGELAARVEQIGGLEGELEVLRADMAQTIAEAEGLRAALDTATSEGETLRAHLATSIAEGETLRGDLSTAVAETNALREELSTAIAEKDALREKLSTAIAEKDALREELSTAVAEREALRRELSTTVAERDAARAEVAARFVEIEGAREENESLRGAIVQHEANLRETLEALEGIRGELAAERAARAEARTNLEEAREALSAKEDELAMVRSSVAQREAQITEELAEAHARAADAEGDAVSLRSELAAKEERWVADLNEKSETIGDLEGKLHAAEAEARRVDEEGRRALGAKVEALRTAERTIQQLEADKTQAERAHALEVAALRAQHGEVSREVESLRAATAGLTERLDEAETLRAQAEREWRASAARKDARVGELSSQLAADRDASRKREEDLRRQLEELQAGADAARSEAAREIEARDRSVQELTLQARTAARKAQELERALAEADAARAAHEGERDGKVAQIEAQLAEATARVHAAARGKREAELRIARETEEMASRHRSELERRDQQRAIEVSRLQAALQEKTKALKVAELELSRIKARIARTEGAPNVAVASIRPTSERKEKPELAGLEFDVEVEKA